MGKPKRGRKTLQQQLAESHAAQSYYARLAGKPPPPKPAELAPRRKK
jgi:hypothetical protein